MPFKLYKALLYRERSSQTFNQFFLENTMLNYYTHVSSFMEVLINILLLLLLNFAITITLDIECNSITITITFLLMLLLVLWNLFQMTYGITLRMPSAVRRPPCAVRRPPSAVGDSISITTGRIWLKFCVNIPVGI